MKNNSNSQRVYSTDSNNTCPKCGKSLRACKCNPSKSSVKNDGVVRIRREVKGRKGKTVTTVTGIPASQSEILSITGDLKRYCGCGGAFKDGVVVIQGDHRDKIRQWFEKKGYQVKLAGG